MSRSPLAGFLSGLGGLLMALAHPLPAAVSEAFLLRHEAALGTLFEALDPEQAVVGPLREQWRSGQRTEAAEALSAYFREKAFPLEILEPLALPENLLERADAALENRFFLLDEWGTVPARQDGPINWLDRGNREDKERAWMLNRHDFLPILAEAARQTGQARYTDQANALLEDWILANPYPNRLTFSPPWRALEVARRLLNSWVHLFYGYRVLSDETRLLLLVSVLDHADALRGHASFWGGNHLISEKLALLTLAVAWPEFAGSASWRDYAIDRVSRQLLQQTYPDGSYKELSNHYQRVVLVNAQYFIRLLAHVDPAYRSRPVLARVEQMWDFFAWSMRPDGTGPLNNAGDHEFNAGFVAAVSPFYDRADWLHMTRRGEAGPPPAGDPSRLFPWAGQAFLRTGWGYQAGWAYFDAGPYGSAHQHVDRFHVSASVGGRPVLVDAGRYTYQPGPWRDYFKGPNSHNVLLLDGQAAAQAPRTVNQPLPVVFQTPPGLSMAAATAWFEPSGRFLDLDPAPRPVSWTRAVILLDEGALLVVDHLVAFQDHDLQANWHFHPDIGIDEAGNHLRLVHPAGALLPTVLRGQESPEIAGFHSPDYNRRLPSPVLQFRGRLQRPTSLVWLLQEPGRPGLEVRVGSDPGAPVMELELQGGDGARSSLRLRLYPEVELLRAGTGESSY